MLLATALFAAFLNAPGRRDLGYAELKAEVEASKAEMEVMRVRWAALESYAALVEHNVRMGDAWSRHYFEVQKPLADAMLKRLLDGAKPAPKPAAPKPPPPAK